MVTAPVPALQPEHVAPVAGAPEAVVAPEPPPAVVETESAPPASATVVAPVPPPAPLQAAPPAPVEAAPPAPVEAAAPAPPATPPPAPAVAGVNPVADTTTAAPVPASVAGVNGAVAQTILLIEDDERIAKFYTILFEAKGFNVENARDGLEGVDMASSVHPSLILLDVMMPKMNGLMVLQTLRANPETEHTPVVVLSNYMEPPLIQRALQLGAIEYVVKSQARPEQLVNALPSWLKGEPALH
jgi:CheY-like chemotaxis protein